MDHSIGKKQREVEGWITVSLLRKLFFFFFLTFSWSADNHSLSAIECFYFAVITATTIGYGDISPITQNGKGIGTIYVLFGCATVAQVLGAIAGVYIDAKQEEVSPGVR